MCNFLRLPDFVGFFHFVQKLSKTINGQERHTHFHCIADLVGKALHTLGKPYGAMIVLFLCLLSALSSLSQVFLFAGKHRCSYRCFERINNSRDIGHETEEITTLAFRIILDTVGEKWLTDEMTFVRRLEEMHHMEEFFETTTIFKLTETLYNTLCHVDNPQGENFF